MKRLSLAVLFVALFAAVAFAAVQDFGAYTVDVPDGWTATPDGETVGIVKDDNSAAVSITYDSTDGASTKELADAFVEALNGKNLEGSGDAFTFEMTNANGVDSKCFLFAENGKYALIVATGIENAPDEISSIMDSLHDKD